MKQLMIVSAALFVGVCASCNTSKSTKSSSAEESQSDKTRPSPGSGDAVFSYKLDGNKISGGEVDATNNVASLTKSDHGDKFSFFLGDAYQTNRETFAHSLRFAIPAKTGAVTLTPDHDDWSVELFVGNGQDDKYVVYGNEAFDVTVASKTATRMSGTFAGKLKLVNSTGAGKAELAVTEGKFDVPVRSE